MKRGKRYVDSAKKIDRTVQYESADAIKLVKENATAKFDETIELHIRTGCDGPVSYTHLTLPTTERV